MEADKDEKNTIVSGSSALAVWRTPPIVRALLSPSIADEELPLSSRELNNVRSAAHRELAVWRNNAFLGRRGRPVIAESALDVLDSIVCLAPSVTLPVEVLVPAPADRRRSDLLVSRVLDPALAHAHSQRLTRALLVASPELTLLTLAPRLSLERLVMVAAELCGSFTVFRMPEALRDAIERMAAEGTMPRVGGWFPSLDREGRLTDLWARPPLTTPGRIASLAREAKGKRGRDKLHRAAELVRPGAASPFEVRAGMLLGLPPELGGEGYGGFEYNVEVRLSPTAMRLARRRTCRCDLFWGASDGRRALDLECQSLEWHADGERGLSDSDRTTALQSMDIEVLLATWGQFATVSRFDALSQTVAEKIGHEPPARTPEFLAARARLRREVLTSWDALLS